MNYAMLITPVLYALTLGTAGFFAAKAALAYRRAARTKSAAKQAATRAVVRQSTLRSIGSLLIGLVIVPAFGIVPAGSRGVVYSLNGGVSLAERGEGVTLLIPWVQHLNIMSVRTQKVYSDKIFAQSLDLQEITVVASVNYHVDPASAADLYQRVGSGYQATVIQPALFQRMKEAVGQVKAEDFAANRALLASTVQADLTQQLAGYGIVIEYVNIEDAIFDPNFIEAVKNKVIADQNAAEQLRLVAASKAKAQQVVATAEGDAKATLVNAEAQAKANRLLAASLTPGLIQYKFLVQWDGVLPTTLVGTGPGGLPFFMNKQVG